MTCKKRTYKRLLAALLLIAAVGLFSLTTYAVEDGWYFEEGKTYYYQNETPLTGFQTLIKDGEEAIFYFNEDGVMLTGFQTLIKDGEEAIFYFNEDGVMLTGKQSIDDGFYMFDESGAMLTGWTEYDGNIMYFFSDSGRAAEGINRIDGKLYYFGDQAVLETGLGWAPYGDGLVYIREDGSLAEGRTKISGNYYCFSASNGLCQSGWQTVNGASYYFKKDSDGRAPMLTGLNKIGKYYYYFSVAQKTLGQQLSGWRNIDKKRYYFGTETGEEAGRAVTGIQKIGEKRYYFSSAGVLQKSFGWLTQKSSHYFVKSDGSLASGIVRIGGRRYYFSSINGKNLSGWRTINGKKYYFQAEEDGRAPMLTGLNKVGDYYYYFSKSSATLGQLMTGWKNINGGRYYFSKINKTIGRAATGLRKIGDYYYFFDESGIMLKGCWQTVDGSKYYFDSHTGRALTGYKEVDGVFFMFKPDGRMHTGWFMMDGNKYYLNKKTGLPLTGLQVIGKYTYLFDEFGVMQTDLQTVDGITYYFAPGDVTKAKTGRMRGLYEKLVDIAKAERGYVEKKSNKKLDSKKANAGKNNYTKYWRDIRAWGLGNFQGQPWCAGFVYWCSVQSYGQDVAKRLLYHEPFIYCPTLGNHFKVQERLYTMPEPGDIVLFWNGHRFSHTGIVYKVTETKFYTIEGNTAKGEKVVSNGGAVMLKSYSLKKALKAGHRFARPDYNLLNVPEEPVIPPVK